MYVIIYLYMYWWWIPTYAIINEFFVQKKTILDLTDSIWNRSRLKQIDRISLVIVILVIITMVMVGIIYNYRIRRPLIVCLVKVGKPPWFPTITTNKTLGSRIMVECMKGVEHSAYIWGLYVGEKNGAFLLFSGKKWKEKEKKREPKQIYMHRQKCRVKTSTWEYSVGRNINHTNGFSLYIYIYIYKSTWIDPMHAFSYHMHGLLVALQYQCCCMQHARYFVRWSS